VCGREREQEREKPERRRAKEAMSTPLSGGAADAWYASVPAERVCERESERERDNPCVRERSSGG